MNNISMRLVKDADDNFCIEKSYAPFTKSQQRAFDLIEKGCSVIVYGPAHSGKSYLVDRLMYVSDPAKTLLAAKLYGDSIKSLADAGFDTDNACDSKLLKNCERIIVDDARMPLVENEYFEKMDKFFREINDSHLPFGGIQMIFVKYVGAVCGAHCVPVELERVDNQMADLKLHEDKCDVLKSSMCDPKLTMHRLKVDRHGNSYTDSQNIHEHCVERQQYALGLIESGASVMVYGSPGTGKSYLADRLVQASDPSRTITTRTFRNTLKDTGFDYKDSVDAMEARIRNTPELLQRWIECERIICVEEGYGPSVYHSDFLDKLEQLCRQLRGQKYRFGGIQMVLIGERLYVDYIFSETVNLGGFEQ